MRKINLSALPWDEQKSPAGKFHSLCRNISLALGGIRNGGLNCGGHPFDVQHRRIPAGAAICPFHAHLGQWELFMVETGSGLARAGDTSTVVKMGDVFMHPPGEAHQLINTGATDLVVMIIADNPPLDAFYYPDSDKWGLRPPGKYFRMQPTDYFEGEESLPPEIPFQPYQPSTSPPAPPLTSFNARKINSAVLPWTAWASPKGKFRGTSKELSLALGAKRNTPSGLGGHPFDLELSKLAPGECGCPFHSHVNQWELLLIRSGTGSVRTTEQTFPALPGDAVLFYPGDAHQLTNAGTDDLIFYLITDNPGVDIWHYPDSNKWGFPIPAKIFRMTETDYWADDE